MVAAAAAPMVDDDNKPAPENVPVAAGWLDDIPFHVYAMKEPNYLMSLMSSYGTNNQSNGKEM